jgi:hypothetical protein
VTKDYRVKVYKGSKLVKTVVLTSAHHSLTVSKLKSHTKYSVTVAAENSIGYGHASSKGSATTKH